MNVAGPSSQAAKIVTAKKGEYVGEAQKNHQTKQTVYNWPRERKLLKLAIYSSCQQCQCNGWKAPGQKSSLAKTDKDDPCQNCTHALSLHTSHLNSQPDEEINRLLGMVVDVERIYLSIQQEGDDYTRNVYLQLFKLLRRCITEMRKPSFGTSLAMPPFEIPIMTNAVMNFVRYKFGTGTQKELQIMFHLSKVFLNFMNQWLFETPNAKSKAFSTKEELITYKKNYTRWLIFCYVPAVCDSFPHFETTNTFGRTMLRNVFKTVKKQLIDKINLEKGTLAPEKKLVISQFPRFLDLIEEEIYSPQSPIWDPEFKPMPSAFFPAIIDRRKYIESGPAPTTEIVKVSTPGAYTTHVTTLRGRRKADSTKKYGDGRSGNESKRRKIQSANQDNSQDIPESLVSQIILKMKNNPDPNYFFKQFEAPKYEEEVGIISIAMLYNSLTKRKPQTLLWLVDLQSVFFNQLPDVPSQTISRLVFDPEHKIIAIIKGNRPIGGICFRPFLSQGFSEIVFCAITDDEQCNGYGTHLMNHLKEYHLRNKIEHFLAFVGNERAIEYFKRQGFNKEVRLDNNVYQGYLRDYHQGILMHCQLNPKIVYTELAGVVRKQEEILKMIIDHKKDEKVYPGLNCFQKGFKYVPVESIPGLSNAGWRPAARATRISRFTEECTPPDVLYQSLKAVLDSIKTHKFAKPFLKPVDVAIAPGYYNYIKYPMDLKTMTERLESGYYITRKLFIADMQRIFNNCRTYNTPETNYFEIANTLDRYFQAKIRDLDNK